MFASRRKSAELKLIDFGLSSKFGRKTSIMNTMVGTPYYVAPEVLNGLYSFKCDMWSAGVLMYVILSGTLPFPGETDPEIFRNVKKGELRFSAVQWNSISAEAKLLVRAMIDKNSESRITADLAL